MPLLPSDSRLQDAIEAAAANPTRGYDELIALAAERLLRLTRKMLRNYPQLRRWEQTDDVFQTAALRLHRSLADVRPESVPAFFGLAATQIRRTLIDLVRHHFGPLGAAARYESDVPPARRSDPGRDEAAAETTRPETLEHWAAFHEAADALPDDVRDVFSLLWYAGLDQQQVAMALDVSVPTVQRRWYEARRRLHDALQGERPE